MIFLVVVVVVVVAVAKGADGEADILGETTYAVESGNEAHDGPVAVATTTPPAVKSSTETLSIRQSTRTCCVHATLVY